ncbi:unnamed protein product [Umbelopsis vinacea]
MPEASVNIQALCKKKQAVESQENLMAEWDGQILKEKQDIANQLQHMGEIFGGLQWYLSRNRTTSRKFCIDFRRLNAVAIKVRYPLLDFVNRLRRGETNYLSTVLGLVFLSGFFQKPVLLITSSASLKCLLDSQADRGAFKMIRKMAEMRCYRIQISSSASLRQKQRQRREDFVAKVHARSFSDLHLLDALQAERWGIERELGAEGWTNHGRIYKLRDVARIPCIHNIPAPGSLLRTLLVTDDHGKTGRRPDVYAASNVDGKGSDMTAYNSDVEIGDEDNAEGVNEHQEEGTSEASEAELSTEDELDDDSEDSNYEFDFPSGLW